MVTRIKTGLKKVNIGKVIKKANKRKAKKIKSRIKSKKRLI